MSQMIVTSVFICLAMHSVICYENAYDLLERRNRGFYEPRYFQSASLYDDRNSFFSDIQNPHMRYTNAHSHFSKFGNGYDNLGNGVSVGHFHPFRRQLTRSWLLERRPYRERSYNNFDFDDSTSFRYRPDYINHRSEGYYPTLYTPVLNENEFRLRGNADFTKIDRFNEDNEDKKHKKLDEFYQKTDEGVNMESLKKEKAGEQLHTDQMGENKTSLRSNKVIKKGRTTKGFAVHHHKDETGNSTTFFDETSNFGGQSDLRDTADGFDSRKSLEQISHKGDEKQFKENDGQISNSGRGLFVGNQRSEKDFSSLGGLQESGKKFLTGKDLELKKTYHYLNGDRFEYSEPHIDNYY